MIEDFIRHWWQHNETKVVQWRRHLHAYPELSHQEVATTQFVADVLRDHGLQPQLFPGTGLMVDLDPAGAGTKGASSLNTSDAHDWPGRLAFRGDMDALPITESTDLPFRSVNEGIMHACGHDVHTAITLGTAIAMHEYNQLHALPTPLRFIFQPAEEVMTGGAPDVIAHGALSGVDRIFALHCEPKLRVGQIGVRVGAITSASDTLEIHVAGSGGHTSRPHLTEDVVYALSKLAIDLPGLLSRRVDPRTGTVLVFGSINAGFAANAIPTHGTIKGTIRTADIGTWRSTDPLLRQLIGEVLAPVGVTHRIDYFRGVPPVLNDDYCTALIADTVRKVDENAVIQAPQSSGGEDFGWYLENVPGAMARLGCWDGKGDKLDLHRDNLVIDERCIGVGVRLFAGIVAQYEGHSETSVNQA